MTNRPRITAFTWLVAYLAAGLGVALLIQEPGPAAWYPPVAVGIGLLTRLGVRWLPFIVVVEIVIAAFQYRAGPSVALAISLPTALECLVGWWILRRLALHLDAAEDALRLFGLAIIVATAGAALGTPAAILMGWPAEASVLFAAWWMGHMTALVTIVPLVLVIARREQGSLVVPVQRIARVEVPLILVSAVGVVVLSVLAVLADPTRVGTSRFLWVVPVLWAAVRYERLLSTVVAVAMTATAIVLFRSPAIGIHGLDLAVLQVTLMSLSGLGLAVSATLAGRREAVGRLEEAQRALEASEQRYTHVFSGSPAIQLLVDPETSAILDASKAAASFYGYPRDVLRTLHIGDLNVEPAEVIAANLAQGSLGPLAVFVDHRKANGELRRMELRAGPIEIAGRVVLHSILRDATDELAARGEIARLAAAVESSAEAIITTDLDGTVTGWNGAAEQLYGFAHDEALGRPVDELLGPLVVSSGELAAMARDRRSIRFAHITRRSEAGEWLPVDLTISPIIAEGEIVGMSRISHDLRESMREEQRLRRNEALLADAAEVGHIGSWVVDPRGGAATWSDELHRITAIAPGTPVTARTLQELAHPDDAARVEVAFRSQDTEAPVAFRLRTADGQVRSVVASWRRIAGSRGEGERIVGVLRDETEERRLEEQLQQARRLESIGLLAGGVAHDFNNLLTAIAGFTDLARVAAAEGDSPDADLAQVMAAVERGRALTTQLLTFGRKTTARPRPVDIGAAIHAVVPMLRRLLGEDITIVTEAEPAVVARVDPGQLDQVLVNLAINARDAMPEGGRLRIAAGRIEAERRGEVSQAAWIEVEDDGSGIDPELLDRIFLPFFTTKDRGRGTGLGLATVHGIVTDAGGSIGVSSRLGHGTRFRLELPGITGVEAREQDAARRARATGSGHVLLVEDEDLVRQVAKRILERAGFRVNAAANASDALEIAGRERPDILVSDIVLPGAGDGISLAEQLHERWPDLPILLMTGYTERVPPPWAGLLTKPYEVDDLVDNVRRLLEASPGRRLETGGSAPDG